MMHQSSQSLNSFVEQGGIQYSKCFFSNTSIYEGTTSRENSASCFILAFIYNKTEKIVLQLLLSLLRHGA